MEIGPYTVERQLFTSGISELFLVHEGRRPAVKMVLKRHLAEQDREVYEALLRAEAEHLSQMRHPSIVRIFPLDLKGVKAKVYWARESPDGPWFYVMEYIEGGGLEGHSAMIKTFPLGWRLELYYQILLTIDYMHRLRWAHCDIKPGNILFRALPNPNAMPRPVLIDFTSVSPADRLSRPSGTLRYASPEMVDAINRPDIRTDHIRPYKADIWSLGALLFEIVTGRPLINEQDKARATTSTMRGEFDDMTKVDPTVPKVLARLVNFMTAKDPRDRPPTTKVIEILELEVMPPPFISATA